MTTSPAGSPRDALPLLVRTVPLDDPGPLLDLLPAPSGPGDATPDATAWVRRGDGLVGWGTAAEIRTSGADRFAAAQRWWREQTRGAVVRDEVELPGTGHGRLRLLRLRRRPRRQRAARPGGRHRPARRRQLADPRRGRARSAPRPSCTRPAAPEPPRSLAYTDGTLGGPAWSQVVAEAVRRIEAGSLEKVVLARDLVAEAARPDRRALAAAPAGHELPHLLDLPRRRPLRRHPGAAGAPRARPGHLPRAGRHHPPHRRRRPRPAAGRHAGAVVEGPRGARVRRALGRGVARAATAPR